MNTIDAPSVRDRRLGIPAAVASLSALALVGALAVCTAPGSAAPPPVRTGGVAEMVAPADLVARTGSWISHGHTLELRPDGTGTAAVWVGAFDGTVLDLRLIPSRTADTVAEITDVRVVGHGGLAPSETPGVGGLVTVTFGADVDTAHVVWRSGHRELSADLCPSTGLDRGTMERLHCGA